MSRRHPDPVQECSQRVEEAWPLTLDPPHEPAVGGPQMPNEQ